MQAVHPLKAWRQRQEPRLTIGAAARALGVSKTAVSRRENRERNVDRELVPEIARRTGIPARELRPDWAATLQPAE